MKKALLFFVIVVMAFFVTAQDANITTTKSFAHVPEADQPAIDGTYNFSREVVPNQFVRAKSSVDEAMIGMNRHDNQNSYAPQNRIFRYADGTIGLVWFYGMNNPDFPDRGSAYNYFNGTQWGPEPAVRIEDVRTGWPSYAPFGATGEIVAAHTTSSSTLTFSRRTTKGTGAWQYQSFLPPPAGAVGLLYPRMITSGPTRNVIHVLAQTTAGTSGSIYQGMDGALLYYRSQDGGATWDKQAEILPGMGSDFYAFISLDQYVWIEPRGNHIAFLAGGRGLDFFLMQSLDGGNNWTKTMIWKNPYNCNITTAPAHYCVDGSFHGAIDQTGKIHVAFGLNRKTFNSWYPTVGGLAYWNTSMPAWLQTYDNTLHPDSVEARGNLIYRNMDFNGDGTYNPLTGNAAVGYYYIGTASMPQVTIDNNNVLFVVFSAMSDINDTQKNYRKLVGMVSLNGGATWRNPVHLTADDWHMFDECVFPNLAPVNDNFYHLYYQADEKPGLAMRGGGSSPAHTYVDNFIYYMRIPKSAMVGIANPKPEVIITRISQNYPNPVSDKTSFELILEKQSEVKVSVFNLMGKMVFELDKGNYIAGHHTISLDMTGLAPGVYFYKVQAGAQSITRKMIVN